MRARVKTKRRCGAEPAPCGRSPTASRRSRPPPVPSGSGRADRAEAPASTRRSAGFVAAPARKIESALIESAWGERVARAFAHHSSVGGVKFRRSKRVCCLGVAGRVTWRLPAAVSEAAERRCRQFGFTTSGLHHLANHAWAMLDESHVDLTALRVGAPKYNANYVYLSI